MLNKCKRPANLCQPNLALRPANLPVSAEWDDQRTGKRKESTIQGWALWCFSSRFLARYKTVSRKSHAVKFSAYQCPTLYSTNVFAEGLAVIQRARWLWRISAAGTSLSFIGVKLDKKLRSIVKDTISQKMKWGIDKSTAYDKPNYTGLINTLAYKNENFEQNSVIPVFASLTREIPLLPR